MIGIAGQRIGHRNANSGLGIFAVGDLHVWINGAEEVVYNILSHNKIMVVKEPDPFLKLNSPKLQ